MKKFFLTSILVLGILSKAEAVTEERVRVLFDVKMYETLFSTENLVLGKNNLHGPFINSFVIGKGNTFNNVNNSFVFGNNSYLGLNNNENGIESSIIIGNNDILKGSNSAIIGNNIVVNESNNTEHGHDIFVLGSNINIYGFKDGIILGKGSQGKENSLSIGSEDKKRKIVFVEDGAVDENSNEVITGKQLYNADNINVAKWKEKLGITDSSSPIDNPELVLLDQSKKNESGNNVWKGTSNDSFAIGHFNSVDKNMDQSQSNNTYILGRSNTTAGSFNQVFGLNNRVNGNNSAVIGNNNVVNEEANSEFGHDVYILGSNINVESNIKNAIILGNSSKAVKDALSIGSADSTKKIVFVSKGEIKKDSTDAINGSQLFEEISAREAAFNTLNEKITEETKERNKEITIINSKINTLENVKADKAEVKKLIDQKVDGLIFENSNLEINRKLKEVRKEITSAIAMANIPGLVPGANFSLGAALGVSNGDSAFAMGVNGKVGNFGYKASLGISGAKNVNFGAGVSYNFGKYEDENKVLNEKINRLEKELNDLKNMLKK